MNTSLTPDDSVSTAPPELSDLISSASTLRSNSSNSSFDSVTDEAICLNPDPQEEEPDNLRYTTNRISADNTARPARTSTGRRPILSGRNRSSPARRPSYSTSVLVLNNLLQFSFFTIMNAALTIFGVGIGVGIILADSFRAPAVNSSGRSMGNHRSARDERLNENSNATVTVSAATPTCRATIRRAMDRIQEAPPINLASISQLPAQ